MRPAPPGSIFVSRIGRGQEYFCAAHRRIARRHVGARGSGMRGPVFGPASFRISAAALAGAPVVKRLRWIGGHLGGHGSVRRTLDRSEEHTSELQSLMRITNAVFCLKNKTTN